MMKRSPEEKAKLREMFRQMSFQKKMEHIWIYHKWTILLTLAALVFLFSGIQRRLSQKKAVLYLAYCNITVGSELDERMGPGFLEAMGHAPAREEVKIYRDIYLNEDASVVTHEMAYASRLKILASIESRQLDLCLMSRSAYDMLSQAGYLMDLDPILSAPAYEKYRPYLVSNLVILEDNATEIALNEADEYEAVTKEVFNGLEVETAPVFTEAGFTEPIYLGIIANTERLSDCLSYVAYIAE